MKPLAFAFTTVNDVLDEAIITDNDVIPLPKLPSNFDNDKKEDSMNFYQVPENRFNRNLNRSSGSSTSSDQQNRSHQSTLERYRSNRDRDRFSRNDDTFKYKDEEKGSRDRIQHEKLQKQVTN